MIEVRELARQLSVDPGDAGVLVTQIGTETTSDEPAPDRAATLVPTQHTAIEALPHPEWYLG
jgi:hypothetical protein